MRIRQVVIGFGSSPNCFPRFTFQIVLWFDCFMRLRNFNCFIITTNTTSIIIAIIIVVIIIIIKIIVLSTKSVHNYLVYLYIQ